MFCTKQNSTHAVPHQRPASYYHSGYNNNSSRFRSCLLAESITPRLPLSCSSPVSECRSLAPFPSGMLCDTHSGTDVQRRRSKVRRAAAQQKHFDNYPPGSNRWEAWSIELQVIGLSKDVAFDSLSKKCAVLQYFPAGAAKNFQDIAYVIKFKGGLSAAAVIDMVRVFPALSLAKVAKVDEAMEWFRTVPKFHSYNYKLLFKSHPQILLYTTTALQQRFNMYTAYGMDVESVKVCWLKSPALLAMKCESIKSRLLMFETHFGLSTLKILKKTPTLLMNNGDDLMVRVKFLKFLGAEHVPLAGLWVGKSCMLFASSKIRQHLQKTGTTYLELSHTLLQLPHMLSIMERLEIKSTSITFVQFYTAFSAWQISAEVEKGGSRH